MAERAAAPRVRLGHVAPNGISPAMFALVEHGAHKHPREAAALKGRVELRFDEGFAPVRLTFDHREVLVEDANGSDRWSPDAVISGPMPNVVQLAAASFMSTLTRVARRHVRIEGSPLLARRLLKVLEL